MSEFYGMYNKISNQVASYDDAYVYLFLKNFLTGAHLSGAKSLLSFWNHFELKILFFF